MARKTKTGRPRTSISPSVQLKDNQDKTIHVNTVKFLNVQVIKNKEELIHLITNVLKNFSKQRTNLLQMRAGSNSISCQIVSKKVAVALARKVASAFKHYTPSLDISSPRQQDHYDIVVKFNE